MYQYVAFVWNPHGVEPVATLKTFASIHPQWSIAYAGPGMRVFHPARFELCKHPLAGNAGVVLGHLFDRQQSNYSRDTRPTLDEAQSATIARTAGQHLIDRYWGTYLSLIYDRAQNCHHIVSDPIGTLPCYRLKANNSQHERVDVLFSNLADCRYLLPKSPAVNRAFLSTWLHFCAVARADTALQDVASLPRGERLTINDGKISFSRVWDPTLIAANPRFDEPAKAARELRETVQGVVDAWASRYKRITHLLSGGLDSSILAGCFANAASKPNVNFLNVNIDPADIPEQEYHLWDLDPALAAQVRSLSVDGNEKHFAHLVARRWNVPLIERKRDPRFDINRLWGTPIGTAPSLYFTAIEWDDIRLELSASHGTQAFFTGQAGDSVLLATMQPYGAIDYAHLHGFKRGLWREVRASAEHTKDSVWSMLGKAIRHGMLGRPYAHPFELYDSPSLLNTATKQVVDQETLYSNLGRLAQQSRLPPGKKNHIEGIACSYRDYIFHSGECADHIDPLNSQPIWELMLALPTYTVLAGGVSRGLARRAFADMLPPEIRKRQSKGTGSQFYEQLVRNYRGVLREHLIDGQLVQQGYLDPAKLSECLALDQPAVMVPPAVLMIYLAAEIWLHEINEPALSATRTTPLRAAL